MLLTAVLCGGKKGKTPGARVRASPPFPLSALPAPPALRPVDGVHRPHRAGAPALRGGRHPQRCRLAGLCEGWAGVYAFLARCFPRLQGGCLALSLLQFLLPWRLSCAVAGAPPAVARFSGGGRPLDPGSGRGLARPVAGGVAPAASRPLGAAGGGAIWALWHCRFSPAGLMEDPRFPCWTSAVSWTASL